MILPDQDATEAAGRVIAPLLQPGDVVALFGDLGAGKTSLARGILSGLGLEDEAPSPTFPIVIPYESSAMRLPVWHVDLYRLDCAEDADELGLDDVLRDGVLLVEWPERLGDRLWTNALKAKLEPDSGGGRRLTAVVPPSWEARWPFQ